MALTRAQLLSGNSAQGTVLSGQVQGVIAGPGLTIDSNGVIQINSQTVIGLMKLGQTPSSAAAAFNGYTWPTGAGSAGQQLTTNGSGTLSWGDPDGIAWTAKGQLVVGTGVDTQTLLNVGANGSILIADSSQVSGLAYTSNYVPTAGATTAAFLPAGNTGNRPSLTSGQAGAIRFNTSDLELEFWNGSGWITNTDGTVTNVTGTAPISVASGTTTPVISLDNTAVTPGTYTNANLTVDAQGRITAAANGFGGGTVTSIDITAGTGITSAGGPITTAGAITVGLANTAVTPGSYNSANITVDAQGRITAASDGGTGTITAVTGTAPIVSSGGATPDISLANTAVTPGSYNSANITVDAFGRITSATDGGNGTVTSVATTANLTGGPITTSGTLDLSTTGVSAASYTAANITVDAYGRITAAANGNTSDFASGTTLLFYQAAAPTGWVQNTAINDQAVRIVGTAGGGSGGTVPFSTLFESTSTYTGSLTITSGQVGDTTLTEAQMPSHAHQLFNQILGSGGSVGGSGSNTSDQPSGSTGGSQPHTHSLVGVIAGGNFTSNFDLDYIDVILCSKS